MNINGNDLTEGSIPKQIIKYSVPMLIGYFLYTGYSIINTIWVGNLLNKEAVGATAVSFVVTYVLMSLTIGATTGTSILVSQYYGAKNTKMVQKVVNNSYIISIILSVALTIVSLVLSDSILKIMNTPEPIFVLASGYLKINLAGFIFVYIFFLVISILRGIGDTMSVMLFLSVSTIINAVLDPTLILGLGPFPKLGLNGAGYASIIAQGIAVILGLVYTKKKNPLLRFNFREIVLEKEIIISLIKISLPSMLQQTLVAIGVTIVTSIVNIFGENVTVAYGASIRVDSLVSMVAMALGAAATTLTGQNIGADKPQRVGEVFRWSMIISFIVGFGITVLTLAIPKTILSVFVQDPNVLDIGSYYLRIVGIGYALFIGTFISTGIINGLGKTIVPMVISILTLWIIRVPLANILSGTVLGYKGIWLAILVSNTAGYIISTLYYWIWKKKYNLKSNTKPLENI